MFQHGHNLIVFPFSFSFFSSHLLSSPFFFSLPPTRSCNSDPGSHNRLFSPPPHYGSCLAFLSRDYFFSSSFPRRLASNCAYPRYVQAFSAVDPFFILLRVINSKSHHKAGFELTDQHFERVLIMRQGRGSEATEVVFCL